MKLLSFIALFFYLSSLLPTAQFSAAHQWVDTPQSSTPHSLTQLTSTAQPLQHVVLSDDDDKILVQLHHHVAVFVSCQWVCYLLAELYVIPTLAFFARAPPLSLK